MHVYIDGFESRPHDSFFSETDFIVKLDRYNHSAQGVKTCNTKCTFKCCFHIN